MTQIDLGELRIALVDQDALRISVCSSVGVVEAAEPGSLAIDNDYLVVDPGGAH